ncbi:hypothetical protein NBRC116584_26330 [Hydrogenophaga sp. 5NK40-0174]
MWPPRSAAHAGRCPPRGLIRLGAALRRIGLAPTFRRLRGSLPPGARVSPWGGPPAKLLAPTLRRYEGRCPPRGLIRLGATLRRIAVSPVRPE